MSYTPGPWEQMPGGLMGSLAVWNAEKSLVVATAGGRTAIEALSNARLIAAAPDLLSALERLTHPMANDDDLQFALETIAKAKGQS